MSEITWQEAEKRAGTRLDRRKRYGLVGKTLCESVTITGACSGCSDVGDYESAPHRGAGCEECGQRGRRRTKHWVPLLTEPVAHPANGGKDAK